MKKPKINAIISGAIAKASGGDFTEGAFRAMVVFLYNDLKRASETDWYTNKDKYNKAILGNRQAIRNYNGKINRQGIANRVGMGDQSYEAQAKNAEQASLLAGASSAFLESIPSPVTKFLGKTLGGVSTATMYLSHYYKSQINQFDENKFTLDVMTAHYNYDIHPILVFVHSYMLEWIHDEVFK